ncbi:glutamate--tRNA ligase [Ruminococcus sp. NK3A76]|uniref:glutamate--tRNA ligase n=1 Tax=Ruminococcus sp. NK3A76 TaxID=877411 RepID=UPI00048F3221|nr:glutamate--tRNA ligase [Ruminococcus sp. NK3A76]
MKKVRTRFAPSPTGYMHIGNLRTALFTYLIAKQNDGDFILRIEDTDRERYVEGAVDVIYNTLRQCGLNWDEGPDVGGPVGPYIQSERMGMFKKYAEELVEKGEAYYCFCDKERLDGLKAECEAQGKTYSYDRHCRDLSKDEIKARLDAGTPYVIRQKMPLEGSVTFHDELYGDITVECSELEDQILIKTDGMPTYNFANVVDDHLMGITHVVRGNEYLSSAPKYELLYKAFGWEVPTYIHVEHIMKDKQHKLSKRDGDASFEDLINKGYLTEAVVNYIALLGWAPKGEEEIFTLDELIKEFDIQGLSKSPAIFDPLKLKAINAKYIKKLTPEEFEKYATPYIRQTVKRDTDISRICSLLQDRTEVFTDIPEKVDFLDELREYDKALYFNKKNKIDEEKSLKSLKDILPVMEGIDEADWTEENIHDRLFELIAAKEVKNALILLPLRVAVSGKASTPGGGIEISYLIGRQDTLDRIAKGIELLSK